MKTHTLPRPIRDAAVTMLRPYCPELTPENLHKALRVYNEAPAPTADPPPAGKLLTVREAAERLSCGRRTVWRLLQSGRLPKRMLGTRSARIPEAAVIELAEGTGG